MISSLLTVSPDNIPDGYGGLDTTQVLILFLTVISVLITIIAACIIGYLYNRRDKERIPGKNWVKPVIAITNICILIILIVMCSQILAAF